ncbi:hypothetical protein [Gardnerella vaginalis]|uniref:Membrane associated protein n=1 Tax=Gardnerella vaginalis TaxID=2702 RepID=A0A2K1SW60_GARVA|nr:hypothetical protein [Gardnerella vaginalis]PNS43758.1 hypothetical protein BFS05_00575 [Gardnerella vaginalis]
MTSSKDTNSPRLGNNSGKDNNSHDLQDDWSNFLSEHAEDFKAIEKSKNAKNFEKYVKREEKRNIKEIKEQEEQARKNAQKNLIREQEEFLSHGPRDNIRSSWLDVDSTMDKYGDDFIPPNPRFNNIRLSIVILWIMLLVGIAGIITSAFIPIIAYIAGSISIVLIIIGGFGLLMIRKDSHNENNEYSDYGKGARV